MALLFKAFVQVREALNILKYQSANVLVINTVCFSTKQGLSSFNTTYSIEKAKCEKIKDVGDILLLLLQNLHFNNFWKFCTVYVNNIKSWKKSPIAVGIIKGADHMIIGRRGSLYTGL